MQCRSRLTTACLVALTAGLGVACGGGPPSVDKSVCGDSLITGNEVCDGEDLAGKTCLDFDFDQGGNLACAADCLSFDTSGCISGGDCGNNNIDAGEDCDGALLGGKTCTTIPGGFTAGTLGCTSTCVFNITGCTTADDCGNGDIDGGEDCDSGDVGTANCTNIGQGFTGGTLACNNANCTFNTNGCTSGPVCGDGDLEAGEDCDSDQLGLSTCTNIGRSFDGGTLACNNATCDFDVSGCTVCGNTVIETGEACEPGNLNGFTCLTVTGGYDGGTLACNPTNCSFNVSGCTKCGNQNAEGVEVCDGSDLNGGTCVNQGFANGGTLGCATACNAYVTTGCIGGPICGDDVVQGTERCDGTDLDDKICTDLGYTGGTLACYPAGNPQACAFNTTGCIGTNPCGNAALDGIEVCDGALLDGQSCATLGWTDGALACAADCMAFDTSGCNGTDPCGNGTIDMTEDCDTGALGGLGCADLEGFTGGTLACDNATCTFNTSGCTSGPACGNGTIETTEQCDGTNLNSNTCTTVPGGFTGGTLACTGGCLFNTSGCTTGATCGNSAIESGEDCEGTNLAGATCANLGLGTGTLACNTATCQYVTTGCTGTGALLCETCADHPDCAGIGSLCLSLDETVFFCGRDCTGSGVGDGACPTGYACYDVGSGAYQCAPSFLLSAGSDACDFCSPTSCPIPDCGNNQLEPGEDCEGTNLGNATCINLGLGFDGGTLSCDAASCTFNTSRCTGGPVCGDNILDGEELCDGTDLTQIPFGCTDAGFTGGVIACNATCDNVDLTGCTGGTTGWTCPDLYYGDGDCDCGCGIVDSDCTDATVDSCTYCGDEGACSPLGADCPGTINPTNNAACEAPACGDGTINGTEDCDSGNVGLATCANIGMGFTSGTLRCNNTTCTFNTSQCVGGAVCGDGTINAGEDCDSNQLGLATCTNIGMGFTGGTLRCNNTTCEFNTTSCTGGAVCGDGVINGTEVCDGSELGGASCTSIGMGFTGGSLACNALTCTFNTSGCTGAPVCGDGIINGTERCDSGLLGLATCTNIGMGFTGGTLACNNATCTFNTSGCTGGAVCGDGTISGAEQCDSGNLGGATCANLGMGFTGGTLSCLNASCTFNTSLCTGNEPVCGDGVAEGDEICDDDDLTLIEFDCIDAGFTGGTISCRPSCLNLDFSTCTGGTTGWTCPELFYGDGECDCGCGIVDSDCGDSLVATCAYCDDWGSCSPAGYGCPGNIDTNNNPSCEPAVCGDGTINPGEACDSGNLGGATCANIGMGFTGGTLSCNNNTCALITTGCVNQAVCGDNVAEGTEICDGSDLSLISFDCIDAGFTGGTIDCRPDCLNIDFTGCTGGTVGWTCPQVYFADGDCDCGCGVTDADCADTLVGSCDFCDDWGSCTPAGYGCPGDTNATNNAICGGGVTCGDGTIDAGEDCDSGHLGLATCTNIGMGFTGGTLTCNNVLCTFNTSQCIGGGPTCGDGTIGAGEDCDSGNVGTATCTNIGMGFSGGTLGCRDATCDFDTTGCIGGVPSCGNGIAEGSEICDGADMSMVGFSCVDAGFTGGTVTCRPNCLNVSFATCTGGTPGWTCPQSYYNDSECDCGCGVADPDCADALVATCLYCDDWGSCSPAGGGCPGNINAVNNPKCDVVVCGDGTINAGEDCDNGNLGLATCANIGMGFTGGTLLCDNAACAFDTSGCVNTQSCGNDTAEGTEFCDGDDMSLVTFTCADAGFSGGVITCNATCDNVDLSGCLGGTPGWTCPQIFYDDGDCDCGCGVLDIDCADTDVDSCAYCGDQGSCNPAGSPCPANIEPTYNPVCVGGPLCGDGVINAGEDCDTGALGGATCASIGMAFTGGILDCIDTTCTFDVSRCTAGAADCGNNVAEAGEICDGIDMGGIGFTCVDAGFTGGTIACNADCDNVSFAGCTGGPAGWTCPEVYYGDGECDCGCGIIDSDCADSSVASCLYCDDWGSCNPAGVGCPGLINATNNAACTGGSATCGDGHIDAGEDCDNGNVGAASCASLGMGFDGGVLGCLNAVCIFDTSGCTVAAPTCGNGVAEGIEICDGDDLGAVSFTCVDAGFTGGTITCNGACSNVDLTGCTGGTAGWTCPEVYYGDGDCDCGCGVADVDCADSLIATCDYCDDWGSCTPAGIGCPGDIDADNNAICVGDVPLSWNCAPSFYGADDGCDCGCGVMDPDCDDATAGACEFCNDPGSCDESGTDCANIEPTDNARCIGGAPPAWTCPVVFWDDGWCDCGCAVMDVDCADGTVGSCQYCDDTGSCDMLGSGVGDCSLIEPADNAICIPIPAPGWLCHPAYWSDGACDCGCGVVDDLDCADATLASCTYCDAEGSCDLDGDCAMIDPANNAVCSGAPANWACDPGFYNAGDGCDCGCGEVDPDCADATAASCLYCNNDGSCAASGSDCSTIFPTNSAICTGAGLLCEDAYDPGCTSGDPTQCTCFGCTDDGDCGNDDCVCADCAADVDWCANPALCNNNGICDPYNEGCVCADCAEHPVCTGAPPAGWNCDAAYWDDGYCDCGCGVVDSLDCADATRASCDWCDDDGSCDTVGDCAVIDLANNAVCTGAGLTCEDTIGTCTTGDATNCTCYGCTDDGTCAPEEDCVCSDCDVDEVWCGTLAACNDNGICDPYSEGCLCADCRAHPECAGAPPVGWTCAPGFYGAGDGCDCGCGLVDPDCGSATAACSYCGDVGSCDPVGDCVVIDPTNNAVCTGAGGLTCEDNTGTCTTGDATNCTCYGCVDDGTCGAQEDCVCSDCDVDEAWCGTLAACNDNGICDPYSEGCLCADCRAHPECVGAPPVGWTCAPGFYGVADGCDCGCGLVDPDCGSATAACNYCGDVGSCDPVGDCAVIDPTNNAVCTGTGLTCEDNTGTCTTGDATNCTCYGCVDDGTCGAQEDCVCSDCDVDEAWCGTLAACNDNGICDPYSEGCLCADCRAHPECAGAPPAGWTCAPGFYGAADGCDCGCGLVDPDCGGATAACDYCGDVGSCDTVGDCAVIDPTNNAVCTGTGGLTCEDNTGTCTTGDATDCTCYGCVDDGTCATAEDCVCSDCDVDEVWCGTLAACNDNGICDPYSEGCLCADCRAHPECAGAPPAGWTCAPGFYGVADGCDCGCGLVDPDCGSATAACDYCGDVGSCDTVGDCDLIDPTNNAVCQ